MQSKLNPYISFKGKAREAMEFYHGIFGGELDLKTFTEFGLQNENPDGIMHATLTVNDQPLIMGSDALSDVPQGFALVLNGASVTADEVHEYFEKLSENAEVVRQIQKEMWGDEYGELVDRFGVRWMFNITGGQA